MDQAIMVDNDVLEDEPLAAAEPQSLPAQAARDCSAWMLWTSADAEYGSKVRWVGADPYPTGNKGRPRAQRILTDIDPTQKRLYDLFELDTYAPQH
jgi:hypothetical protein